MYANSLRSLLLGHQMRGGGGSYRIPIAPSKRLLFITNWPWFRPRRWTKRTTSHPMGQMLRVMGCRLTQRVIILLSISGWVYAIVSKINLELSDSPKADLTQAVTSISAASYTWCSLFNMEIAIKTTPGLYALLVCQCLRNDINYVDDWYVLFIWHDFKYV